MGKIFGWIMTILLILVTLFAIDCNCNGPSKTLWDKLTGKYEEPETLELSGETLENNVSATLEEKDGEWTFIPGETTENFLHRSAELVSARKGDLGNDFSSLEFVIKTTELNKIYFSTGFEYDEQVGWRFFDTSGNVIRGISANVDRFMDDTKTVTITRAEGANEYNVSINLGTYYLNKNVSKENARILISSMGEKEVYVKNIKYLKKGELNNEPDNSSNEEENVELYIYDYKINLYDKYGNLAIEESYIKTNKKVDKIYINSNGCGVYALTFESVEKQGAGYVYYENKIVKNESCLSAIAFMDDVTINVDTYIAINGKDTKVCSQSVFLKAPWTKNY